MRRATRFLLVLLVASSLLSFAFRRPAEAKDDAGQENPFEEHDCLICHGMKDPEGKTPWIDGHSYLASAHAKKDVSCEVCHEEYESFPHKKGAAKLSTQCAECHDDAYEAVKKSVHGPLLGAAEDARTTQACIGCHGAHGILPASERKSLLHPLNTSQTCLQCHRDGQAASRGPSIVAGELLREPLKPMEVLRQRYTDDTHGWAIVMSGLVSAPTCVSCHGGHDALPHTDPRAKVHPDNVSEDCGQCHVGVLEKYRESVHGKIGRGHAQENKNGREPATCTDCHEPHGIHEPDDNFKLGIIRTCANCHGQRGATYRGTYHGRISELGFRGVASCDECHTAHEILPQTDPRSSLHAGNIVETCSKCHAGATPEFSRYQVHADPDDKENYPILWWARYLMRLIILVTWGIWGIHMVLWLQRALRERKHIEAALQPVSGRWYRRWPWSYRAIHLTMVLSFLLLAMTGLPLRFHDSWWSPTMFAVLGGPESVRLLHRVGAFFTCVYAAAFLVMIVVRRLRGERGLFRGPNTLLPRMKDLQDIRENMRWFLKGGKMPSFDRWTYWEKFDFLAEVWGVMFIGLTGLVMWFPIFFTEFLPGWAVNLAHILHSYEALLATGFIFTMHFFNANLRPGKFPVDPMFLTGRISEEELKHERPAEYERMRAEGRLESEALPPPNERLQRRAKVIGSILLSVGLLLLLLMASTLFL